MKELNEAIENVEKECGQPVREDVERRLANPNIPLADAVERVVWETRYGGDISSEHAFALLREIVRLGGILNALGVSRAGGQWEGKGTIADDFDAPLALVPEEAVGELRKSREGVILNPPGQEKLTIAQLRYPSDKDQETGITPSCGNVFADLGLENADLLLAEAKLALAIRERDEAREELAALRARKSEKEQP